ncbi:MAG TPA: adenylate/guanylate cyclase domain-containing protein [Aeromicrobium sp.]|nr:adenylate/guanylate cyclase domain-containing protein [Aeromicrobium sp.]HKY58817.1 adenylate/guanylate cyclase domain-containing protein [Aeromicrobium sp.]
MTDDQESFDASAVIEAVTEALLGQPPTLTRLEVARKSGLPPEVNAARWRALGFPEMADDDIAFTKADVDALKVTESLITLGFIDPESEESFIRTVGRTFARLAEWQVRGLLAPLLEGKTGTLSGRDLKEINEILRLASRIQDYVWRRHLLGAASRMVLQHSVDTDSEPACAGFVDIVGYTTRSRSMTRDELAALVERFESVVTDLITEHNGRVVKTIGDEIFFVVDDPAEAAWLGVELTEQHVHDESFPNVRVGMAYGELLYRLGDVFGPVVNMASRLTSVARPGRAVVDKHLAELAKDEPGIRLKRMPRTRVKGFETVEPWVLKRERLERRKGLRGAVGEIIEEAAEDVAMRLPQRDGD